MFASSFVNLGSLLSISECTKKFLLCISLVVVAYAAISSLFLNFIKRKKSQSSVQIYRNKMYVQYTHQNIRLQIAHGTFKPSQAKPSESNRICMHRTYTRNAEQPMPQKSAIANGLFGIEYCRERCSRRDAVSSNIFRSRCRCRFTVTLHYII